MSKITKEIAISDVENWLESKKITAKRRSLNASGIEIMVEAIEDGSLIYNPDNHNLTVKLKFPLTNDHGAETLTELVFKNRLNSLDKETYGKGIVESTNEIKLNVIASALSSTAYELIRRLDTEDLNVIQAFCIFFL